MKQVRRIIQTLPCILFLACAENDERSASDYYGAQDGSNSADAESVFYDGDDPNAALLPFLLPNELSFERAEIGQSIPLGSLLVMPDVLDEGSITVEYDRNGVDRKFVRDAFHTRLKSVANHHPLLHDGVQLVLTDKRLLITVHPGVVLRLRNGMENNREYRTFTSEQSVGKVVDVKGKVDISTDLDKIEDKLRDFFVVSILSMDPDTDDPRVTVEQLEGGGIRITAPIDAHEAPAYFPPVMIEGP